MNRKRINALPAIVFMLILSACSQLTNRSNRLSYQLLDNQLTIQFASEAASKSTSESAFAYNAKKIHLTAVGPSSIEVYLEKENIKSLPSFARKNASLKLKPEVIDRADTLTFRTGNLSAIIDKNDLGISFYRDGKLLTKQTSYQLSARKRQFDFLLAEDEKILGGGQRVMGMDRRGHRMPLYNRAHYGYETASNQMYFSLPAIMSDKKYLITFDNTASGFLDIGKTKHDVLSFESVGGRMGYIVTAGENYPDVLEHYTEVTGRQPMPPRWAFGNYASRFGYRSEQQVRETIDQFIAQDIPVDAVILDLFWFGPDIKGHLGDLDWDRNSFPSAEKMIQDLQDKGIKTITITEPFVLSTSKNWRDAADHQVLAKNEQGEPYRYDFYFGNTGLIDLFDKKGQDWFWKKYEKLFAQGVAGTWGDLGEPEVHPDDIQHFLTELNQVARGDEVHNAFGHQWAKTVYEGQHQLQPKKRPFIMMRSGFAGSQRYGMIPWTGDVNRSWGGLKPQVELALQMGMLGMAYNHSDLGGFAGGETFDKELYIRWLEYGVFQPVYRPHAQDHIAPEPIFHDEETKGIVREYIKLRYRLLPYLYTMAYQNSTTGLPLMRPLTFVEDTTNNFDNQSSYFWGDSFLVSPIVDAGVVSQSVELPEGVWFNFWNEHKYDGGQETEINVNLKQIPVLVKAGAFVPMVDSVQSTRDYSSQKLYLHYYADNSVSKSQGQMYEDDGESFDSLSAKKYELLNFSAKNKSDGLSIELSRSGGEYEGMPANRDIELVIHGWQREPKNVSVGGEKLNAGSFQFDKARRLLVAKFSWDHRSTEVYIK